MSSRLEQKIKDILQDLTPRLCIDKETYMAKKIKERLDKSLNEYYRQLNDTLSRLSSFDDKYQLSLIKKLTNKN